MVGGGTFLTTLDTLPVVERNKDAPLRLPILSKYKDMGTTIEGKVEQGMVKPGDKLWVMPNRVPVEVLNVWLDQDEVSYLVGGENARIKLKDISDEDIQPGYVLCPRGAPRRLTRPPARPPLAPAAPPPAASHRVSPPPLCRSDGVRGAQAVRSAGVVELLEHKSIFSAGYTAILHVHAAAEECSIVRLTALVDKKTGGRSKKAPMFVKSGAVVACVIEAEQSVCLEEFEKCPQLGRFTLRDEGKTIGIGKCLGLLEMADEAAKE